MSDAWGAGHIFEALTKRYPPPAYALLPEVRNSTGFRSTVRTADALCMGLYPSRGIDLTGFEFKSSRGDWKREMEDPSKAEEIARFCDFWIVVAGHASIVKRDEVPPTWGLMVPASKGDKLKVVKVPERLAPQPLTRDFLASLMRRIAEPPPISEETARLVEAAKKESYERGVRAGESRAKSADDARLFEIDQLKQSIGQFEAAAGIKIEKYNGRNLGVAVRLILDGKLEVHRRGLLHLRTVAEAVVQATAGLETDATASTIEVRP
jgi:hypothetical protein